MRYSRAPSRPSNYEVLAGTEQAIKSAVTFLNAPVERQAMAADVPQHLRSRGRKTEPLSMGIKPRSYCRFSVVDREQDY